MRAALRAQRALLVGVSITLLSFVFLNDIAAADVMNIVALGASNTAGWGVGSRNAYPAQLEAMLRSRGYDAHVANAGVSFDTTSGMLGRVDSAVPPGTSIVILNPGGNDLRFFGSKEQRAANIAMQLGRDGLKWNPDTEQILGDPAASDMISRPSRSPWDLSRFFVR